MQQSSQRVRWWVLGSGGLMVVGAFGPWVKALGQSVAGTDGSNDGWLVVAAAAVGGLLFYVTSTHRAAGLWALLGGAAGVGITLYDRSNVQKAIDQAGSLAQALVQVGWGLNLALGASLSMAIAGIVCMFQQQQTEQPLSPPSSAPPSVHAPGAPSLPISPPPVSPTPPPD
jgi:hypothetical protein